MSEKKAAKNQMRDENEVKRAVVVKALADPGFRTKLLKNPKAAIEAETGVVVPGSVTVKVLEDSAELAHLVLPCARPAERAKVPGAPDGGPEPINLTAPVVADTNKTRAALIAKALKSAEFKAELVKNPKAAIEKASSVKVPSGVTVKVLEDTPTLVHLLLTSSQSVFGDR